MSNGNLQPVEFEMANKKMVAPGCGDLPVYCGEGHFISCWQLTDEQIESIVENKRIWLGIMATGQPPVFLTTDYPFTNRDEWPEEIQSKEGEKDGESEN